MSKATSKDNPKLRIGAATLAVLLISSLYVSAVDQKSIEPGGTQHAVEKAEKVLRDPFWPVGFQPKRAFTVTTNSAQVIMEPEVSSDWNKAMQEVVIQGVSSRAGNEFYAVINGEVKSTGDTVSVQVGTMTYTWMIENISPPSSVKMRRTSSKRNSFNSNAKEGNGYED